MTTKKTQQPKTLFLFEEVPERSVFFVLDGDYRHLHGVYINSEGTRSQHDELNKLVYDTDGRIKVRELLEPSKECDFFVKCGFVR